MKQERFAKIIERCCTRNGRIQRNIVGIQLILEKNWSKFTKRQKRRICRLSFKNIEVSEKQLANLRTYVDSLQDNI